MIDWSACPAVERDPEDVGGACLFRGTRVPVTALFEHLKSGARLDDFVEWFPGVTLAQVRAVLDAVLYEVDGVPEGRFGGEELGMATVQPHDPDMAEARLAELVRQGNAVLPQTVCSGPPPRIPVMSLREILEDLDESRADR